MSTPLLTTKLYIPPVRPELVPRPHLIERLNAGLHRKLTLVSAPASFGKTTIAQEFVVSVNTVRSHIKSIYGKLDVHSRYEVVARAKGLNLL